MVARHANLDTNEMKQVDRIELWALKNMLGLPPPTPTAAVRYVTGTLFTDVRVEMKQILYLHRLLQKENGYWAKEAVITLKENNVGWAKNIVKTLIKWGLDKEWDEIASTPKNVWKKEVEKAAEERNKINLSNGCQTKQRGASKSKTKTKTILEIVESPDYKREPLIFLKDLTCIETRALIMGRYGMLDCKSNFSMGYGGRLCEQCNAVDNEDHRMNECEKYCNINRYDNLEKIDFDKI